MCRTYIILLQCASLLLSATKWSYPLHSLVDQKELHLLLTYSTSSVRHHHHHHSASATSADSANPTVAAASLEWRRRTLQNLCLSILHHGEVRPCLEVKKAKTKREKAAQCKVVVVKLKKSKVPPKSRQAVQRKKAESKEKKSRHPVHYNTFVISNIIEYRRLFMSDCMPEHQLQKIAKGVYGSILLSLLNARPLSHLPVKPKEAEVADDVYSHEMESLSQQCHAFPTTLTMLVASVQHLLEVATVCQHPMLSKVDMLTVLSFWHEINQVLTTPTATITSPSHSSTTDSALVTSRHCCSILVDHLLAQTTISSALWQASLVNILSSLRYQLDLFDDYDKLLAVLVQFFVSSDMIVAESGLVPAIVRTLLSFSRELVSQAKGRTLSGECLLMEVLITAVKKR